MPTPSGETLNDFPAGVGYGAGIGLKIGVTVGAGGRYLAYFIDFANL